MLVRLAAVVVASLLALGGANAAEIKMLSSGAVKEAYLDLIPQFTKQTGHQVNITWAGTVDLKKMIAAGEIYDLIVVAAPEIETFASLGKIKAGSRTDLVKSSVGVAVRLGAPKPDISSGENLKKALLAAKSIGFSTGPSGVYLLSMFQQMGIADAVKPKSKQTRPGFGVAKIIANGEAEIGFQQVSELIHEPGIDFLGPLSPDVDRVTVFSSGIHSSATQPDTAKALQAFLSAPERAPVLKKYGLNPP